MTGVHVYSAYASISGDLHDSRRSSRQNNSINHSPSWKHKMFSDSQKIPFYATRMFSNVFIKCRHLSPSYARLNQSRRSTPTTRWGTDIFPKMILFHEFRFIYKPLLKRRRLLNSLQKWCKCNSESWSVDASRHLRLQVQPCKWTCKPKLGYAVRLSNKLRNYGQQHMPTSAGGSTCNIMFSPWD
jgi:hypothetical protein